MLSARSARTLYNVADALVPPGTGDEVGAGDLDLVPEVETRLQRAGPGAARRLQLILAWIEWDPVLTLRARRSFSQLPRPVRSRLLDGWRTSRLAARRRAFDALEGLVRESWEATRRPS